MPVKANEALDMIGVDAKKRNMKFAEWGADPFYGRKGGQSIPQLFPKLTISEETSGETMEELMRRRRAEKEALKKAFRQKQNDSKIIEESTVVKEAAAP
jgi:hypothetical protein